MSAARITVQEVLDREGTTMEQLQYDVLFDLRHSPALCEDGCEVEPDGTCPHGHPPVLLAEGLI